MGPLVAVPLAWPVVEAVLREDLASRPLVVSAVLVVNERTRTSHKPMGSRSDPVRDGLGIVPVRDRHSGPSNCVLPPRSGNGSCHRFRTEGRDDSRAA
jgi:hypothetical protein